MQLRHAIGLRSLKTDYGNKIFFQLTALICAMAIKRIVGLMDPPVASNPITAFKIAFSLITCPIEPVYT
jgi:hypothetical protein